MKYNPLSAKQNRPEELSKKQALRSISEEGAGNENKAIGGMFLSKLPAEESFWTFVAKRQN